MADSKDSSNFDLFKYPIVTEKSTGLISQGQYTLIVDRRASKTEIKKVFEVLFEVKVIKINTCNLPKKFRRVGKYKGAKPQYKKACVTIEKTNEQTIDLFSANL